MFTCCYIVVMHLFLFCFPGNRPKHLQNAPFWRYLKKIVLGSHAPYPQSAHHTFRAHSAHLITLVMIYLGETLPISYMITILGAARFYRVVGGMSNLLRPLLFSPQCVDMVTETSLCRRAVHQVKGYPGVVTINQVTALPWYLVTTGHHKQLVKDVLSLQPSTHTWPASAMEEVYLLNLATFILLRTNSWHEMNDEALIYTNSFLCKGCAVLQVTQIMCGASYLVLYN